MPSFKPMNISDNFKENPKIIIKPKSVVTDIKDMFVNKIYRPRSKPRPCEIIDISKIKPISVKKNASLIINSNEPTYRSFYSNLR